MVNVEGERIEGVGPIKSILRGVNSEFDDVGAVPRSFRIHRIAPQASRT